MDGDQIELVQFKGKRRNGMHGVHCELPTRFKASHLVKNIYSYYSLPFELNGFGRETSALKCFQLLLFVLFARIM